MLEEKEVAYRRKRGDGYVQVSHAAAAKQNEAIKQWHRENCVAVSFRFSKANDAAILEKLATVQNKTDYIRALINADIEKRD